MKAATKNKIMAITVLAVILTACLCGVVVSFAQEQVWYVCFSYQNYAVRNANKMKLTEDGYYILENVSLTSAMDFYVTDNNGLRFYAQDNDPLSVEETTRCAYDIRFSPEEVYDTEGEWAQTNCHITYRFYTPQEYSLQIDGTDTVLTYNPFFSAYDLYYISEIDLPAGAVVSYEMEEHTVESDGRYRILFTPDKTNDGNLYKFNSDGQYGSGDDYQYNVYIEDAPQYFFAVKDTTDYYPLARNEDNTTVAEYRSEKMFISQRDYTVKYNVFELVNGKYKALDDDNDEDTVFSKIDVEDVGWYQFCFVDGGNNYRSSFRWKDTDLDGYYIVGDFNNYGFDEVGGKDIDDDYKFAIVEEEDDDYNEDYDQYILYLTVTQDALQENDVEFYISNGKDKYKNGSSYISLNTAGEYKILFSEDHIYSRGRHYRYTLQEEDLEYTELVISNVNEFVEFAEECSASADYSTNLKIYLAADLDFAGKEFVPVKNFSGIFYGNYHAIKNITISDGKLCTAVFENVMRTATIERLNVQNLNLDGNDYVGFIGKNYGTVKFVNVDGNIIGKNYVGGVVAYNSHSVNDEDAATTDSNDILSYAAVVDCVNSAKVSGQSNVGGIAGCNLGKLDGCKNLGEVLGKKSSSSSTVVNLGGICGNSEYRIINCENRANITGGDDSLYIGGVCGITTGEIYFAINRGNVSATRHVGGICGYYGTVEKNDKELSDYFNGMDYESFLENFFGQGDSNQSDSGTHKIEYTANFGNVSAFQYAGGIVGRSSSATLDIYNSASIGDVSVSAGNYAGGIAGYLNGGNVYSTLSAGTISAKGLGAGKYVGGIAGYANNVYYSMSAATVKGKDFVGGIAGQIAGSLIGCYTNVMLVPSEDASSCGLIAGVADAYNTSLNSFGEKVKANYYIGDLGGITGVEYGQSYNYAAASAPEDFASCGNLSAFLSEDFLSEYWQGGAQTTYPTLFYFEQAHECTEFDDEDRWNNLFESYKEIFEPIAQENARITYTVIFMEWNKDNGDLEDDGILYDNFDIVQIVRVHAGDSVSSPELIYAEKVDGQYIYEGKKARYFVSFAPSVVADGNITVYAQYVEICTSATNAEETVFVEGQFYKGTTAKIVEIGNYRAVKLFDGEQELPINNVTVKVLAGEKCHLYIWDGAAEKEIEYQTVGKFISFEYNGEYFRIEEQSNEIPFWAWILIGGGSVLIACGIAWLVVALVRKKRNKEQQIIEEEASESSQM